MIICNRSHTIITAFNYSSLMMVAQQHKQHKKINITYYIMASKTKRSLKDTFDYAYSIRQITISLHSAMSVGCK